MGRLNPRETFFLYALMAGFSLLMFAGGVYVGKTYYVEAQPLSVETVESPEAEEVMAQVDSLNELVSGADRASQPSAKQQDEAAPSEAQEASRQHEAQPADQPPAPQPKPAATPAAPHLPQLKVGYTVQVGAFNKRPDADKVVEKLRQSGYTGMVADPEPGGDDLYRVWVGQFATRQEAAKLEARLKSDKFGTLVKKVSFPSN